MNDQAGKAVQRIPMSERTHARVAAINAAWFDLPHHTPEDLDEALAGALAELYEQTLNDTSQTDAMQEFALQALRRCGMVEVETLLRGYLREAE